MREPVKLVKIKTGEVFPLTFPNSIEYKDGKKPKLEYFKRGEGYKKTVVFEVLNETLPNRTNTISWLDIAKLTTKYGIEVGEYLAEGKVAGIIARQSAKGFATIYNKIKDIIPENFDPVFFENMKCDYIMSCFGMFSFDIVAFDKWLTTNDPDYSGDECTYKGKKCSMRQYIELKYGEDYVKIVEAAMA